MLQNSVLFMIAGYLAHTHCRKGMLIKYHILMPIPIRCVIICSELWQKILRCLCVKEVTQWEAISSLWPSDAIWRQRTWSTLVQVMACCLMAPSHYLNQCWLIISEVPWHIPEGNFRGKCWRHILKLCLWNPSQSVKSGLYYIVKECYAVLGWLAIGHTMW